MGRDIQAIKISGEDRRRYRDKVRRSLDAFARMLRERQFARYQAWRQTRASYPPAWREAANDSEYLCYLTVEELRQMNTEVSEVMMRLNRGSSDSDRRPITAWVMLF